MRELTQTETTLISGGANIALDYAGLLSQEALRSIHAEVRAQMNRLLQELERSAHQS